MAMLMSVLTKARLAFSAARPQLFLILLITLSSGLVVDAASAPHPPRAVVRSVTSSNSNSHSTNRPAPRTLQGAAGVATRAPREFTCPTYMTNYGTDPCNIAVEDQKECGYEYVMIGGCNGEPLDCIPTTECTCNYFQTGTWDCIIYDYFFAGSSCPDGSKPNDPDGLKGNSCDPLSALSSPDNDVFEAQLEDYLQGQVMIDTGPEEINVDTLLTTDTNPGAANQANEKGPDDLVLVEPPTEVVTPAVIGQQPSDSCLENGDDNSFCYKTDHPRLACCTSSATGTRFNACCATEYYFNSVVLQSTEAMLSQVFYAGIDTTSQQVSMKEFTTTLDQIPVTCYVNDRGLGCPTQDESTETTGVVPEDSEEEQEEEPAMMVVEEVTVTVTAGETPPVQAETELSTNQVPEEDAADTARDEFVPSTQADADAPQDVVVPVTATTTTTTNTNANTNTIPIEFYGLNYNTRKGPDWAADPVRCKSRAEVVRDLTMLSRLTTRIRLLSIEDCDQGRLVWSVLNNELADTPLQMWLGLWVGAEPQIFQWELTSLENILKDPETTWDYAKLLGISVGSEAVYREDVTVEEAIANMDAVKAVLAQYGITNIPTTIVEIAPIYSGSPELRSAVDTIMTNTFPFWEGHTIDNAVADMNEDLSWLLSLPEAQNKPFVLSEHGWPSEGYIDGVGIASPENQQQYLRDSYCYLLDTQYPYYLFTAIDNDWRQIQDPLNTIEGNWGFLESDLSLKAHFEDYDFECGDGIRHSFALIDWSVPAIAEDDSSFDRTTASCQLWTGCTDLGGDCCPTPNNDYLGCCRQENFLPENVVDTPSDNSKEEDNTNPTNEIPTTTTTMAPTMSSIVTTVPAPTATITELPTAAAMIDVPETTAAPSKTVPEEPMWASTAPLTENIEMATVTFTVTTTPLGDDTASESETTLFIPQWTSDAAAVAAVVPNDVVCFMGSGTGLEPNIASIHDGGGTSQCSTANGCGVHVHAGTSCDTTETQGGHWYNTETLSEDPWAIIGYQATTGDGNAQYASCVRTGFDVMADPTLLEGHVFIVHGEDGSRISCGQIQQQQVSSSVLKAETLPIPGTDLVGTAAMGEVNVMSNLSGSVTDGLCYMGYATGLQPNVVSFLSDASSSQCNAPNGCGAHIHSGTACDGTEIQGGHYYDMRTLPEDPWELESYYTTNSAGMAAMIGCVITGNGSNYYESRPFIVHGTDGGRLLCGLLEPFASTPIVPAPTTTTSPPRQTSAPTSLSVTTSNTVMPTKSTDVATATVSPTAKVTDVDGIVSTEEDAVLSSAFSTSNSLESTTIAVAVSWSIFLVALFW